jgi:hypothetical protein
MTPTTTAGLTVRARALAVAALAAMLVMAGCTDDSAPEPDVAPPPTPFRAADARLPEGWTRAQCSDLTGRDNSGLAVRVAVPPGYLPSESDARSCTFTVSIYRDLTVSFGPGPTLASEKEREVDPYTAPGQGDGQLGEVEYAADVAVYGQRRGERLDYFCYCDGQNLQERTVLADGVRLHWTTKHGGSTHEEDFSRVAASMALVRDPRSTCHGSGRTAIYRPPIPQTESIDHYGARCHVYLRPGRGSLQRYAEVVPAPRRTLGSLADGLRRQRRFVHDVRLERGVASLDGQPADQLSWLYTRERTSVYGDPAGTWRIVTLGTPDLQVTWGGRPRQWRAEGDVVRRFVDSVHLLPR